MSSGRVERSITGFVLVEEGHWVALLDCGHRQHVRHDPPLTFRPVVLTEAGRRGLIGMELVCPEWMTAPPRPLVT